jgi:hypothetical protein
MIPQIIKCSDEKKKNVCCSISTKQQNKQPDILAKTQRHLYESENHLTSTLTNMKPLLGETGR